MRPVDAVRVGVGVAKIVAPGGLLAVADPSGRSGDLSTVARVLGARYVVQAAVGTVVPGRAVWRTDAAVDLLHAASMLLAARRWPEHRRVALVSALTATAFAGLDLRDAGTAAR